MHLEVFYTTAAVMCGTIALSVSMYGFCWLADKLARRKEKLMREETESPQTYAVWHGGVVWAYCMIRPSDADKLNQLPDAGLYFGFDRRTRPEKYKEDNA